VHYYKFNIPAWGLSTSHLSLEEEAIYFRLVNFYYDTEQPIPLETQSVFRRLRLATHEKAAVQILEEFFVKTKKGFVHAKCDEVLAEYKVKAGKNQTNGKNGGRPKKIKPLQETQEKPTGLLNETHAEPKDNLNYKPITNNQEPITNNQEQTNKTNPYPGMKSLDDIDFSRWPSLPTKETMQQWLKVRKSKKATNSQIAMDDVCSQLIAAHEDNTSAEDCIRFAVAKSWAGFNYQWIKNQSANGQQAPAGGRHINFNNRDYTAGVTSDGTF